MLQSFRAANSIWAAMKATPLHEEHISLGARMTPFAGWDMPIQYTSVIDEHIAVREHCGMFDVSHMGDVIIRGEGASALVRRLMTNNVADASIGRCVYSHILDEDGMIIDDTIAAPIGDEEYLMVPNAATTEKIVKWARAQSDGQKILDISDEIATIAVQGPMAATLVTELTSANLTDISSFRGVFCTLDRVDWNGAVSSVLLRDRTYRGGDQGVRIFLSRTGYTGEDGFEIACDNAAAVAVWRALTEHGEHYGLKPIGLGARDTLRLEKGLLLSGTDFDGAQTSLQTGPPWVVKFGHGFIGEAALEKQSKAGGYPRLVGVEISGRGIPRHGYEIHSDSSVVGAVTSGTMSPVLRKGIALGYVPQSLSKPGTKLHVNIRNDLVDAEVVETPFVRRKRA